MSAGENRFNRPFFDALDKALDEVERSAGPAALVTAGEEKFYSNGLDLDWLIGDGREKGRAFLARRFQLLARVLALPRPDGRGDERSRLRRRRACSRWPTTIRVMRADRGFFCLPEIDIDLAFAPGMLALIHAKLDIVTCRNLMLTGRRVGGEDAVAMRIVDETAPAEEVASRAVARAAAAARKIAPPTPR